MAFNEDTCISASLVKWYRDLGGILPRSRQDSCRDPAEILAAGFPVPAGIHTGILGGRRDSRWPNLGGIPAGILPGFLAGGRIPGDQNLGGIPGGNLAGILGGRRDSRQPKSRQDPGGNLTGILGGKRDPGGQNLGRIPAGVLPGFLVGDGILGGQNLGRIPAGVLPGFLAGNRISRWECCRDLRRETKFLAVKIFPAARISRGPVWNLARIRDENHN